MRKILHGLLFFVFASAFTFCTNKSQSSKLTEQSHTKSAKPNYSIVFPNDKVNRVDIKIDKTQWDLMMVDLKSNIGGADHVPPRGPRNSYDQKTGDTRLNIAENGHRQRMHEGPPPGAKGMRPGIENDSIHSKNRGRRMGPPPGGTNDDPIWAYCDILFNNEKWDKVGIRFKGNSSLRSAYQTGIKKLSFKLDFDQFETEFPEIKNQRFYGFKQLNLKNNYDDNSFIREKVASDLFADFGLVSPKTSFYQVFVDYGDGPIYFGLYTLVEEVDDTVIKTGFLNENGNLYKPEGRAATLANGSFRTTEMDKKNNKKSNDYSDVKLLNTVINSLQRLENPELWKSELSEIFDVSGFIKYLAANNVIQNWDTYGVMPHNYYLYNNPSTNKLTWIAWDNNEAFQHGKMPGALALSLDDVNEGWPLIRYILDDEEWRNEYKKQVADFSANHFNTKKMNGIYAEYEELLKDYVIGEQGEKQHYTFLKNKTDFTKEIEFLKQHVVERKTAVQKFLSK